MERVRLDRCDRLRVLVRGLEKLSKDLTEAAVRTPPTITSRQLLEEAYKLSLSLLVNARLLEEECG
ncbi:MAG: hypothetical protein GSR74_01055 [Desulfurococcales archaeon]|nr:hypothetical protein [Desulfurococcales archaeon]